LFPRLPSSEVQTASLLMRILDRIESRFHL